MPLVSPRFVLVSWAILSGSARALAQEPSPAGLELFESRVRPLLLARCGECHGSERPKGGLDLSQPGGWLTGGDLGPAIVPGDADGSRLIQAVRYSDPDLAMPPRGKLSEAEVRLLEEWVAAGAPAPEAEPAGLRPASPKSSTSDHWAFQPLRATEPGPLPASELSALGQQAGAVDRYLAQARAAAGLVPAARADRRSLARRASQVLIGLDPQPSLLATFLADPADEPEAFAAFLDELFRSPHYGEHMARQWLDLVRYADSNGLDENLAMAEAWRYRDFVVQAFNQHWTYDRFVRAQLAGDLLPPSAQHEETFGHWTATGFWLLGPKMLAEQDQEKLAIDIVDEQIDVFSKTFLGLTVACARCHDHKFDPISARDYYALAGILRSTDGMASLETVARWRERELIEPELLRARELKDAELKELRDKLAAWREASRVSQSESWHQTLAQLWLSGLQANSALIWLEGEAGQGNLGADLEHWGEPEVTIVHTVAAGQQHWSAEFDVKSAGSWALLARYASGEARPMQLALDGLPHAAPALGRQTGGFYPAEQIWEQLGVFELSQGQHRLEFSREGAAPHLDKLLWIPLPEPGADPLLSLRELAGASARLLDPELLLRAADWTARASSAELLEPLLAWRDPASREQPPADSALAAEVAALQPAAENGEPSSAALQASRAECNELSQGVLDGPRAASLEEQAVRLAGIANGVWRRAERARQQDSEFDGFDDQAVEAWRRAVEGPTGLFHFGPAESPAGGAPEVRAEGERLTAAIAEAEAEPRVQGPNVLCVREGAPVELRLHVRGSHLNQQGEPIPRGAPAVFEALLAPPTIPAGQSGRLELANWLLDPRHPLTARVLVNRLWQQAFGIGLVESASNFGLRGARPSHPELLDYLAGRLIEGGWSIQSLQREILLSIAFAQTSLVPEAQITADPENRWLARYARQRLSAEALRDALLNASGMLDRSLAGSLLSTPDYDYVTNDQSSNQASYDSSRRALYLPIVRNAMYGFFSSFDYADPSLPIERRSQTTVPAQALHLLNSPLAQRAAAGAAAAASADAAPMEALFQRILLRAPSPAESEACASFLAAAEQTLGARARPAAEGGALKADAPADNADGSAQPAVELGARQGALTRLANVLLASSEFLYFD